MRSLLRLLLTSMFLLALSVRVVADESVPVEIGIERDSADVLQARIQFSGSVGLKYTLLRSVDLVDWTESGHALVGSGSESEFAVTAPEGAVFFKIRVEVNDTITSAITAIEYPIHVYVPQGYESSDGKYPIIYATDGQWISEGFSSAIEAKKKQVLLVTIEQGPGDRRAIDYLLPGANAYFDFLKRELIPAVESVYRVESGERSICGTSYGGLLVGLVLLMDDPETPLFKNYLSFDGSFWTHRSATNALEQARFESSGKMAGTLYLTSALGRQNNNLWVTRFQNQLEAREYEGLEIVRRSYNVEHNDVAQPSFEEALDVLFE